MKRKYYCLIPELKHANRVPHARPVPHSRSRPRSMAACGTHSMLSGQTKDRSIDCYVSNRCHFSPSECPMLALEGKTLTSRSMEWKVYHQLLWLRTWGRTKVKPIPSLSNLTRLSAKNLPGIAAPYICLRFAAAHLPPHILSSCKAWHAHNHEHDMSMTLVSDRLRLFL